MIKCREEGGDENDHLLAESISQKFQSSRDVRGEKSALLGLGPQLRHRIRGLLENSTTPKHGVYHSFTYKYMMSIFVFSLPWIDFYQ